MMNTNKKTPKLRFKGFSDDWEQCKLDDIAKIKTGGGTPKTAKPEYWSGNIPWIQSSDLVEGDITHVNINKFINNNALKNSAAKLISRDSIALVTRVGVGKVAVINQDFTTSQDFLSLSDFDRSDIKFLAYQLYRLMQENAKVLQGTSIKGITKTELIEQSISIPNSGQEQHLISNVLSKIDSIITLHQCKLEKLKLTKKALLQKLFPKNGKHIPEIRFKGFTDAWEQRKLGDLTQLITKGTTPKVKNIQNGINFIKVENISDDGVISINSYVSEEEHMNYLSRSILSNDDILFSIAGTLGRTAIVKSHLLPANTNQALAIIRLNKSVDVEYINTFLKSNAIKTYIRKNPTVGAQPNLSLGQVSDLEINIPSYSEQKKISNLFSNFDLMITLHQCKLDRLISIKKALLQQLFV